MEAKIKEVKDYFKSKILKKEFEIKEMGQHTFIILVDQKYKFTVWVGNPNYPDTCKLYDAAYSFMQLDFNQKERIKLHGLLKKDVEDFKNRVTLPQKMAEFEKLKKELNIN